MEQLSLFKTPYEGKNYFYDIALSANREGTDKILKWLSDDTDFFTAPASTRFHGAYSGGLLAHSLRVFCVLRDLAPSGVFYDSIIITSLFHDICKANFYTESTRNVKNKETGKWEQVPYYAVDEALPFGGHGSKSVYLLLSHGLELSDDEAIAINNHMGGWDVTTYHNPTKAFETVPLALYLHIADLIATNHYHE